MPHLVGVRDGDVQRGVYFVGLVVVFVGGLKYPLDAGLGAVVHSCVTT